jgi:hypothetical protein
LHLLAGKKFSSGCSHKVPVKAPEGGYTLALFGVEEPSSANRHMVFVGEESSLVPYHQKHYSSVSRATLQKGVPDCREVFCGENIEARYLYLLAAGDTSPARISRAKLESLICFYRYCHG